MRGAATLLAAALLATGCAQNPEPAVEPVATASAAPRDTQASDNGLQTSPGAHPCDQPGAYMHGPHCLHDGQSWTIAEDGRWAPSDGPPTTTSATD